ncbi:MAG TPA: deazaflavin-dependent nitroreductase [Candidatus Dormibacteraeota bacterium]|nr:deazaflavin-dependent nitroreductase [Candidatus Dormibacteraeota bacterium]
MVSPFVVYGRRYVLSFGDLAWVRNARTAHWGLLSRGRRETRVRLIEIEAPESAPIVREFPVQIPAGARFFIRPGLVAPPAGPDQFEAAAGKLALFRLDPD